jgi:hypothetical protein
MSFILAYQMGRRRRRYAFGRSSELTVADARRYAGELRQQTYSTLDEIRELLRRFKVSVDQGEKFENGIRCWSIGACFVTLTPRQYLALKTKFPTKGN